MPNRRSPDADMSPYELRSLRSLGEGQGKLIADAHRELLVRMGLARVNGGAPWRSLKTGRAGLPPSAVGGAAKLVRR
jgi:hypothetical protein